MVGCMGGVWSFQLAADQLQQSHSWDEGGLQLFQHWVCFNIWLTKYNLHVYVQIHFISDGHVKKVSFHGIFDLISENFFQDIGKVALFQLMALFVIGSGGQAIKGIYWVAATIIKQGPHLHRVPRPKQWGVYLVSAFRK